jgi:hypothetical protein
MSTCCGSHPHRGHIKGPLQAEVSRFKSRHSFSTQGQPQQPTPCVAATMETAMVAVAMAAVAMEAWAMAMAWVMAMEA